MAKSNDEESEVILTGLFNGYSSSISISQFDEQLKEILSNRLSRSILIESLEGGFYWQFKKIVEYNKDMKEGLKLLRLIK